MDYSTLLDCREKRSSEFELFLNDPHLMAVLNRLVSFLTDNSSKKISLTLTAGDSSYTNGKTITLGMPSYFFAPEYGPHDWTLVFKTLLVHESQHINSSCFRDIKAISTWFGKLMEPYSIPESVAGSVAKNMLNIIEDGRIENIAIHKLPGFKLPFVLLNGEIRQGCAVDVAATEPVQEFQDFIGECLSYAKTGKHAPGMEVYKGSQMEKVFVDNKHFIDDAIDARSSADCTKLCKKFLKGCSEYLAGLLKDEDTQKHIAANDGQDEYTSNKETELNPGSSSGAGANASTKSNSEDSAKGPHSGQNPLRSPSASDQIDRSEDWTDDFSGACPEPTHLSPLSPAELRQLRQGVQDEIRSVRVESESPKAPNKEIKSVKDVAELYTQEAARRFQESFPVIPDEPAPAEVLSDVHRLERTFRRILLQKTSEQRNLRHGLLNIQALSRARMGDTRVFMKPSSPNITDFVVEMIIDNSGSMNSNGATMIDSSGKEVYFSKSSLARMAACIIEASFQKIAPLKITLFDVSGGTIRHQTIKKFDEKTKGGKCYSSITTLGTGNGNKDGYSIRVATSELLSRRERRKILIVLSDGLPSDYNGGSSAGLADVHSAVKEARQKGIAVIPIMFGNASFREQSKHDFSYMYDNFISCDPIAISSEFEKLFVKLVKHS